MMETFLVRHASPAVIGFEQALWGSGFVTVGVGILVNKPVSNQRSWGEKWRGGAEEIWPLKERVI